MARPSTRTAILDSAEQLVRAVGLVRVTTKAVASAADCSEASIYYHFHDRADLLAEVVARRLGQLNTELAAMRLPEGSDTSTRLATLITAVAAAYSQLIALSSPLLADPEVLSRFRAVLEKHSLSLHGMQAILADHLEAEQQGGRLRSDVDPQTVALIIAGTCHEIALEGHLAGHNQDSNNRDFLTDSPDPGRPDPGSTHGSSTVGLAVHALGTTLSTMLEPS